jgi:hypothetical protein
MTLPAAIWLCPVHHDEFHVPHGGTCPEPGCHEDLVGFINPRAIIIKRTHHVTLNIDGRRRSS